MRGRHLRFNHPRRRVELNSPLVDAEDVVSALLTDLDGLLTRPPGETEFERRLGRVVMTLRAWRSSWDGAPQDCLLASTTVRAELMRMAGMETEVRLGPLPSDLDHETCEVLTTAVRVLTRNVTDHSNARRVSVTLLTADTFIGLMVEDDGRGFDVDGAAADGAVGCSLNVLHGQLTSLGGRLDIMASPGRGSNVQVRVPWRPGEAVVPTSWTP